MVSEQQLEALANSSPEDAAKVFDAVVDGPKDFPVPEKTEQEKAKEEALKEQLDQNEAMKKAMELPFKASDLGVYAQERFKARLPAFVSNTERQVRQAVAYGADSVDIGTLGANNFHSAVFSHLHDAGFSVVEKETGSDKSRIEVKLY